MKLNQLILALILTGVVLVTANCGGGGGDDAPQTVIGLTTSDIRAYQQGDTLTASLSLRETSSGQIVSGDITITVGGVVQNPFGIDCRSVVYSGTLTGTGGTLPYQIRSLFYQDVNNSLYNCGEFNDTLGRYTFLTDTATTPNGLFLELKSPVALGNITSGVAIYDDGMGTWEDCTEVVQSIENVSTPLGLYESYRIAQTCSYSDGTSLNNTIWNVPAIFNLKEMGNFDGFDVEFLVNSFTPN